MGQPFNLESRVAAFAAEAISVCEALPPKTGTVHIRDQLFRAATSVAANYAESSVSESRKDFAHKMNIALKELVESRMWLRIIALRRYLADDFISSLVSETEELVKIFHASVSTARKALSAEKRFMTMSRSPFSIDICSFPTSGHLEFVDNFLSLHLVGL